jgi:hypothetical protein
VKKLLFIILIIGLFLSCSDIETKYLSSDPDDQPVTDRIIGTWIKDGNAFTFMENKSFTYFDYYTEDVHNTGSYTLLDGRLKLVDISTEVTQNYFFEFVVNYPYAGSESLKLTLVVDTSSVGYWERVE